MNIVAIGGGDRTPAIKRSLELSGEPARVLVVPSSASTEASYNKKVAGITDFFKEFGVAADILHGFGEHPSKTRLEHEIGRASLIYTLGGNSPFMIRTMHQHGSTELIQKAIANGTVHAGTSAGALLPFRLAHSNVSARPSEEEWDYSYLRPGVDSIDAVLTAHANQHDPTPSGIRADSRFEALLATFPDYVNTGFAIDNNAAAVFGEHNEIIRALPSANVHYIERRLGEGVTHRIADDDDLIR